MDYFERLGAALEDAWSERNRGAARGSAPDERRVVIACASMTRIPLTPRPRAPVLVHTAALGAIAFASAACGDDGGSTSTNSSNATDVFPTAGPCYHQDPPPPECASTGQPPGTTGSDTGSSSAADGATDMHPTAGPCAHDPQAPECASTTDGGSDSGTATDGTAGTGTSTGTGTGTTSG